MDLNRVQGLAGIAVNGQTVAYTHAESADFAEAVDYARRVALPKLLALAEKQIVAL